MSRVWMIVILSVLAIPMFGCCEELEECETKLEECETKLAECCPEDQFTLVVKKDGYGVFQPFSNRFHASESRPFRDGILIQAGEFYGANHPYKYFTLTFDDGTEKTYTRANELPVWIDVRCGGAEDAPITVEMARTLTPVIDDPDTHDRRLHAELNPDVAIVPITLWAPESGLGLLTQVEQFDAEESPEGEIGHGHVEFTFSSAEECQVQVWTSWPTEADPTTPDVFPAEGGPRVTGLTVGGTSSPRHGGPHQPPWEI
jgi:hypothetical protein